MLINLDDLQSAINIDLTDPNGQTVATDLIAAATGYISSLLGFPIEQTSVTTYFDGDAYRFWIPTGAPVASLAIATYNPSTNAYDTLDSQYVRHLGDTRVSLSASIPEGPDAVRATYTTGWTAETLPADLKQALIELVALKLQEATNFSSNPDDPAGDGSAAPAGALKRVVSLDYTEEYGASSAELAWKAKASQLSRTVGDSVPGGIMEVVQRYRVPFAL